LEKESIWRYARLRGRGCAFLHQTKKYHATLAREHTKGRRVCDANEPISYRRHTYQAAKFESYDCLLEIY